MQHPIFLALLISSLTSQAAIYQWVDTNGKVHFSDKKPTHIEAEEKHYQGQTTSLDPE